MSMDINTNQLRENPLWICTRTGDELTEYCHEQGCAMPYYGTQTVLDLCDEIDRLRAKLSEIVKFCNDWNSPDDYSYVPVDAVRSIALGQPRCDCRACT